MKITLHQDEAYSETEIIINCRQADEDILKLVAGLRVYQKKLVGVLEGEQHLLDVKEVLYIDTADKRTVRGALSPGAERRGLEAGILPHKPAGVVAHVYLHFLSYFSGFYHWL